MRNLLSRLFGGPSQKALATAHHAAEVARLSAINRDPPPGNGWRVGDQDSEGKWTVWNGPRPIAAFWDENDATAMARRNNQDPRPNPVDRDDGKYCVNCGSHETDESLKARGYVNCCPERYCIPEVWGVTGDRLATGQFHIWRPADGLETVSDTGHDTRAAAQTDADARNLALHRAHRDIATSQPEHPGPDPDGYLTKSPPPLTGGDERLRARVAQAVADGLLSETPAEKLAAFLDVPIPEGVRAVVGPRKSPQDGNWWVFTRAGPYRGYTRKPNAQLAADRVNNAPQT